MVAQADFGAGAARGQGGVRLRTVALPVEHGGWGITLEPLVLGLLVAPSLAGVGLAVATLGAFLARHPFKIVAGDRRRGRRFARTPAAERFTLGYGAAALAGLLFAVLNAPDGGFLLPLAVALPLAAAQLYYDATGRSRALLPELAGSTGMAGVAASVALAGGAPLWLALGLWAVLAARVVPTILYVRARLARLHGKDESPAIGLAAHAAALAGVGWLAWAGVVPWAAAVVMLLLLARAVLGTTRGWPATARGLGFSEIAFGALTVFAVAAGLWRM